MNIFPGNVLIIDDQFDLVYKSEEPTDPLQLIQWNNFKKVKNLIDNQCLCYSTISNTSDIELIVSKIKQYCNVRLLILDLDLDESGDVEDGDIAMVKTIIKEAIDSFGYFILAINSSYDEKWEEIKKELIDEFQEKADNDSVRKISFLNIFSISLSKNLPDIEGEILNILSNKFSNELVTQFEVNINHARDAVLNSFIEFDSTTWEDIYLNLKSDMDSKENINLTINGIFFGLLRQYMVNSNYSTPDIDHPRKIEEIRNKVNNVFRKEVIQGFNYLRNTNNFLDKHPIWTGNLYYDNLASHDSKYKLVITPECDIAKSKSDGYVIVKGFEFDLPIDYNPKDYKDKNIEVPQSVKIAGKNGAGDWKSKNDIMSFYIQGEGYYILYHSSIIEKHIILDFRNVEKSENLEKLKLQLLLRVNEPIITDINDNFSALYNRKGIPRITGKDYLQKSHSLK